MIDIGLSELAKIAFDAYRNAVGGKTYDGKLIPEFENVSKNVQAGWIAAVIAVLENKKVTYRTISHES